MPICFKIKFYEDWVKKLNYKIDRQIIPELCFARKETVDIDVFAGIYPSNFANVQFWTKIEFLNVVKCRWGSWGAVSSTMGSWWSIGGGSGGKTIRTNK